MKILALLSLLLLPMSARAATTFTRDFAAVEGIVTAPEMPLRQEISLNGRWQFQPIVVPPDFARDTGAAPALPAPNPAKWDATPLKVPSPWNVNTWGNGRDVGANTARPYSADSVYYPSYPRAWDGAEMGWLRRSFRVPADWGARRVVLHFEGVAGQAQIWVNGRKVGEHFDEFMPFEFDVTDQIKRDGDNELLVGVRKSSLFDIVSPDYPANQKRTYPNGSNMDDLVGIWNDVSLLGLPALRVSDVFVQPLVSQNELRAQITIRNDGASEQTVSVGATVSPWRNLAGQSVLDAPEPKWRLDAPILTLSAQRTTIAPGKNATIVLRQKLTDQLKLWSLDAPNLYGLVANVTRGATIVDKKYTRFGWREWTINGRELRLNGAKIQLNGDLLHPFGPFIGSRRYAWAWMKMVKDVGGNAIRPHAQPRPRFYLDLADEMGVAVLDEAAVFGSSISLNFKSPQTWERLENHVDDLVKRDRNHASVFGWSPANEMFAQFLRVSPADKARQLPKLQALALRPRALDPTRPWISADGDEDLGGVLPTWNRHFGIGVPDLPDVDKPLMVGEQGGTYYASPPHLEPLAGEVVYRDTAGRNQGLAFDLYRMLTSAAHEKLSYFSPSELAWFGLEPLPLGTQTDERVPNLSDGVFFGPYVEGRAGVQPERLPPYSMTLNPGFDAALPLYRSLPMFEAMRDGLRGNANSKWAKLPVVAPRVQSAPSNAIERVGFVGPREGALFAALFAMGVPLAQTLDNADLLIVDGDNAGDVAATQAAIDATLRRGKMVWIMARATGETLQSLRLPPHQITTRHATSLVRGDADKAIDGFGLGDLYFAEASGDREIQKVGLQIATGRVLLRAADVDWTLWNDHGEVEKNSNVLIYQHLRKPAGAALIDVPQTKGKLWISTLDPSSDAPQIRAFWRQLMSNVGVKLNEPPSDILVASARNGAGATWSYTFDKPAANWFKPNFDDANWKTGVAGFGGEVPGGNPHTAWNTNNIWLRREFEIKAVPRTLNLEIHHDEDVEVFLNGTRIFAETGHLTAYKSVPLDAATLQLLRAGRNVLAVHCLQTAGGQYIDVGLTSAAPAPIRPHDLLLDGPLQ